MLINICNQIWLNMTKAVKLESFYTSICHVVYGLIALRVATG